MIYRTAKRANIRRHVASISRSPASISDATAGAGMLLAGKFWPISLLSKATAARYEKVGEKYELGIAAVSHRRRERQMHADNECEASDHTGFKAAAILASSRI